MNNPVVLAAIIGLVGVIITAAASLVTQIIMSKRSHDKLLSDIRHQSEIADIKLESTLERHQEVYDNKIAELTREVREHNNFARRVPVIEQRVDDLTKRVDLITDRA